MKRNDLIAWVLHSPFHGMLSGGMMLITITGRKTGKHYTTPVNYYRDGDSLWVITSRGRKWWRNLRGGAEVGLLLKRKPIRGIAETEMEERAVEARLFDYIKYIPQSTQGFGIRMENGKPNTEDIARVAKDRLFVRIKLV